MSYQLGRPSHFYLQVQRQTVFEVSALEPQALELVKQKLAEFRAHGVFPRFRVLWNDFLFDRTAELEAGTFTG